MLHKLLKPKGGMLPKLLETNGVLIQKLLEATGEGGCFRSFCTQRGQCLAARFSAPSAFASRGGCFAARFSAPRVFGSKEARLQIQKLLEAKEKMLQESCPNPFPKRVLRDGFPRQFARKRKHLGGHPLGHLCVRHPLEHLCHHFVLWRLCLGKHPRNMSGAFG